MSGGASLKPFGTHNAIVQNDVYVQTLFIQKWSSGFFTVVTVKHSFLFYKFLTIVYRMSQEGEDGYFSIMLLEILLSLLFAII